MNKKNEQGMILAAIIGLMMMFTIIGVALLSYVTSQYSRTRQNIFVANATQTAEAGLEQTLYQINQNENFGGYTTEQVFFNNPNQGKGVFTTTIAPTADSNAKTITATGKVYRKAGDTNPASTRKLKVTIVGTMSEGYSIATGPGGLILGGIANINNSDVYVNGKLTMNGAARIGSHFQPVNVYVANNACPSGNNPGPTYPTLCGSNSPPLDLAWSTFIYGSVCATGQTSKGPNPYGNIQPGAGGQGLITGCTAPVTETPTYDKAAQIAAVTTTGTSTSNTYVCNNWPFDRTWPANLKLTGNVKIDGACDIVIKGDVYITGNLDIGGASRIRVDNSAGTRRPHIIVDGTINVDGIAQILANNQGTGVHFISFKSNAACASSCTTLSGTALKTTQGLETVSVGGAAIVPGIIFQAYWGKVTIGGIGSVGAAIGQTVDMGGAGTVIFGTVLSSGTRSWSVTSYQEVYN